MLLVCALIAIVASVAVPVSLAGIERQRAWSAARFVAARLSRARAMAVTRATVVAVRFEGDGAATAVSSFADMNHNGVLTREIESGVDRRLDGPLVVSGLFPGVVVAIETGAPRLFSFSPDGTAAGGSVYLASRDGGRFAVRVLGATGRIRLERYLPLRDTWVESF